MTKSKVEEIFRIAGNVIEIDLKTDKDGRSRGMCTVRYEHPMEAVQAIGILDDDDDDDDDDESTIVSRHYAKPNKSNFAV